MLLVTGVVDRVVAVDEVHARAAAGAWRRFGKGRHPAGLNVGDCFAYDTAKTHGCPLLYIGGDFRKTDLQSVLV